MAIDIENPGENEDSLKQALAGLTGMAMLVSGSISSATDSIDLSLPTTYARFVLVLSGMEFSKTAVLQAAFSPDGGDTLFNDIDDFDDYDYLGLDVTVSGATVAADVSNAANLIIGAGVDLNTPSYFEVTIYPGSTGLNASMWVRSRYQHTVLGGHLNDHAVTLLAATGRQNFIRIATSEVFDGTPSPAQITAGRYELFGSPA